MKRWWAIAKWIIKAVVAMWFLALPLMPVYGWLRPWREAEEALRQAGVAGTALMIGGASSTEHTWSTVGHVWREEEHRSFAVIPESLHDWKLFTYFAVRGSGIEGAKTGVVSTSAFPTVVMWVLAGLVSLRTFFQLRREKPNKAPEPTP